MKDSPEIRQGIQDAPVQPASIYQSWLDRIGTAIWKRDFETAAKAMAYPQVLATDNAKLHVEKPAQIIDALRFFRDSLHDLNAEAYHRICKAAWFVGPDASRIEGHHITYVMRGARTLVEPYQNAMSLVFRDGRWLGAGIRTSIDGKSCVVLSPDQTTPALAKRGDRAT